MADVLMIASPLRPQMLQRSSIRSVSALATAAQVWVVGELWLLVRNIVKVVGGTALFQGKGANWYVWQNG